MTTNLKKYGIMPACLNVLGDWPVVHNHIYFIFVCTPPLWSAGVFYLFDFVNTHHLSEIPEVFFILFVIGGEGSVLVGCFFPLWGVSLSVGGEHGFIHHLRICVAGCQCCYGFFDTRCLCNLFEIGVCFRPWMRILVPQTDCFLVPCVWCECEKETSIGLSPFFLLLDGEHRNEMANVFILLIFFTPALSTYCWFFEYPV